MDNKDFKKHLRDLAHGHHHPEEHDWSPDGAVHKTDEPVATRHGRSAKRIVRKAKHPAK